MEMRRELSGRQSRSQTELQCDAKTVRYELNMLLSIADAYAGTPETATVQRNALVESFAIHCRAMLFFLFGHLDEIVANGVREGFAKPREGDVLAFDFNRAWDSTCPPPTEVLVLAKRQADKHVAHITTGRRAMNQPGSNVESVWRLGEVAREIASVTDCFLRAAAADAIGPSERKQMDKLLLPWLQTDCTTTRYTRGSLRAVTSSPNQALDGMTDARTISPPTAY
jgi:hypothetical protein